MNALLALARTIHIGSAMLLFGELLFLLVIAIPVLRGGAPASRDAAMLRARIFFLAHASIVAGVVSALAWLAVEAITMSGRPLLEALGRDTLALVLLRTTFGRLWILRFGLAIVLYGLLWAARRSTGARAQPAAIGALVIAGAYLATLAWAGHAGAGEGADRALQLSADVVHLLAAGAWIGALPGLLFMLRGGALRTAAEVARHFSTLGLLSVSALVLSGFGNAWYLVGNLPALFATSYGQLLLAKLSVFAVMLMLAATNRAWLTPKLQVWDEHALQSLRRNALLETAGGVVVVAIVGILGITVPGAHQGVVWPLDWTLSLEAARDSMEIRAAVVVAGVLACVAASAALLANKGHRLRLRAVSAAVAALSIVAAFWLLAVPANPTTYAQSPVRYTTSAVARGAIVYAKHCSGCHGAHGHGDGPLGASMALGPANLAEHAAHHRVGDLYWWIGHGIPGGAMPPFGAQLSDEEIWSVAQFLRALAASEQARSVDGKVDSTAVMAPDFTFEIAHHGQESLVEPSLGVATLLVFYTLPASLPRLRELADELPRLRELGARVIAVPMPGASSAANEQDSANLASIVAITRSDVANTYTMFGRVSVNADRAPAHMELLIDRQGYLRARWLDAPTAESGRFAEIQAQIEQLKHERVRPVPMQHAH